MISKEEMRAMTSREMEAYMRGYRDGQVDLREILYTNVIPVTTPVINPTITCDTDTSKWTYDDWKAYLNETFGVAGGDTIAKY